MAERGRTMLTDRPLWEGPDAGAEAEAGNVWTRWRDALRRWYPPLTSHRRGRHLLADVWAGTLAALVQIANEPLLLVRCTVCIWHYWFMGRYRVPFLAVVITLHLLIYPSVHANHYILVSNPTP